MSLRQAKKFTPTKKAMVAKAEAVTQKKDLGQFVELYQDDEDDGEDMPELVDSSSEDEKGTRHTCGKKRNRPNQRRNRRWRQNKSTSTAAEAAETKNNNSEQLASAAPRPTAQNTTGAATQP